MAAVDAIVWPLLAIYLLLRAGEPTRLFGAVAFAILALVGLSQLRTAIWFNGRYRFTSWLVLKPLGMLAALGLALKLFVH